MVQRDLLREKSLNVNLRDNEKDYCETGTLSKFGFR